ncbi:MAG: STAS domain-containing protein, partial [Flavobacteriaceae bacterium]|nr:STAS domain-containing protein [Flavobacteriaceae bacterium]
FFGSTSHFQMLSKQVPDAAKYVIVRMDRVPYIDQSGLYALEDVLLDLEKRDIHPLIVDVQNQPLYLLQSIDIVPDLIPEEHLFDNFNDCIAWIKAHV